MPNSTIRTSSSGLYIPGSAGSRPPRHEEDFLHDYIDRTVEGIENSRGESPGRSRLGCSASASSSAGNSNPGEPVEERVEWSNGAAACAWLSLGGIPPRVSRDLLGAELVENEFLLLASAVAYYAFTAFVPFLAVLLALAAELAPDITGSARARSAISGSDR